MQQTIIKILKGFVNLLKDIRNYYRFPRAYIAYRGVFKDFAQAQQSSPNRKSQSYNDETLEKNIENVHTTPIANTEYPFFFWLHTILGKNPHYTICDFGGGFGRHYFHYTAATKTTPQWIVCELPHKVQAAQERDLDASGLVFSSDVSLAHKCEVVISSSAFQYIENLQEVLKELLGGGAAHILLARLPMQTTTATFVTLQNVCNDFFTPFYVFNKDEFIGYFTSLGYELIDIWDDPFDSITLPFHRDIDIHFCGFYFRLASPRGQDSLATKSQISRHPKR